MSRLSQRIERLEGSDGAICVLGFAPAHWHKRQQEAAIEKMARLQGVKGHVDVVALGLSDPAITDARIHYIGQLQDIFDYVASHGKRIGERTSA